MPVPLYVRADAAVLLTITELIVMFCGPPMTNSLTNCGAVPVPAVTVPPPLANVTVPLPMARMPFRPIVPPVAGVTVDAVRNWIVLA